MISWSKIGRCESQLLLIIDGLTLLYVLYTSNHRYNTLTVKLSIKSVPNLIKLHYVLAISNVNSYLSQASASNILSLAYTPGD